MVSAIFIDFQLFHFLSRIIPAIIKIQTFPFPRYDVLSTLAKDCDPSPHSFSHLAVLAHAICWILSVVSLVMISLSSN